MDLQPNKTDAVVKPITETRISASEWNQLVGSCMEFITAAGFTPDAEDNQQFLNAFIQIAQNLGAIGANVDLSNLSATGEGKFDAKAGTDLSNLTATGKAVVSNLPMPDITHYDTLTIGADQSNYTAPADGYFYLQMQGDTDRNTYLEMYVISDENSTSPIYGIGTYSGTTNIMKLVLPVQKGYIVKIRYNVNNTSNRQFGFFYCKGAN